MISIRPLNSADSVEALTQLLHTAYASLAAQGWNFTAATQPVEMTQQRLEGAHTLLAFEGERLVGTVAVRGPKSPDETYIADAPPALYCQPGTAILSQFAVHPDCRGQGLGEALMDAAEAWARAQGYTHMALDTAVPAEALRRRYLRRGYADVGLMQWSGKTYASVLMLKPLA